ncbi:hsp70-binding protein 1 isoform X1 [Perognathus longimembris pacificus]|uniref:hsp70-binding protein 1 isoform X1 n=2 Tax=Perognathus longimembris pacificus TaxID=214514 RepID=UPI002019C096|nr:hsp70-binding protein 1 isoform X1 [Perognathus longimembris pacificus]
MLRSRVGAPSTSGLGHAHFRPRWRRPAESGAGDSLLRHGGGYRLVEQTPQKSTHQDVRALSAVTIFPPQHISSLHKRSMADQGSGGNRLPLALPPASQGCSSGGSGSSAGGAGNPRPPRNLQGLLQMAITAGSQEPDPPPEPMSEERRQWLQEAMSAAFRGQREEVEQMKNCLRVLSQPMPSAAGEAELASDQQEREGALELLADLCENMDNAADFCQLSGMHLLVGRYLEARAAGLRWRAAQLIGTCSQNVAAIQEQVLGLGALRKLLRLLDRDSCDTVRVKALFAISCLVREQEAGLLQFLRLDGFSVLMRAMQQQVQKLKVKSAFLLQNLLVGHPEHKGTLCAMGMVQQLVALVRTEHSPFHEHVLGALCSLVTDFPQGVRECREPELGLEELLRHRCQLLQQHEEYQEELEFCEKLLQTCFSSPTDDSMDR